MTPGITKKKRPENFFFSLNNPQRVKLLCTQKHKKKESTLSSFNINLNSHQAAEIYVRRQFHGIFYVINYILYHNCDAQKTVLFIELRKLYLDLVLKCIVTLQYTFAR